MYIDQSEKALQFSQVALERSPERFTLTNHGLILIDLERYEEAYEIFNDLLREYKMKHMYGMSERDVRII